MSDDQETLTWSIEDMPWKSDINSQNGPNVVLFNGNRNASQPVPSTSGINYLNRPPRMKRKTQEVCYL